MMSAPEPPDTLASHADASSPALEIPSPIFDAMIGHSRLDAPYECCGILGGVAPRVLSFHPLRNIATDSARYLADPHQLIVANSALRRRHHEIVAIYHSHPRWEPVPSTTDLGQNYWSDTPRIIISLLTDPPSLRVWRLNPDSYVELPWRLLEPA
jgi:proteasome lid subunit RPN8/RPN11